MITTAVVPFDGSPGAAQAVSYARAILPAGGQIILLHVLQDLDPLLPELLSQLQEVPGELGATEAARAILDQVIADAGDARLDWQTEVVRGEPAPEILRVATRVRADAIVMTTHGRGALGRAVFGSVADRIARTAPVPVLLIRPDPAASRPLPPAIRRLVIPLDGSTLAEGVLPVATELALRRQVPVHLVRVVNLAALLAPLGYLAPPGVPHELYDETIATACTEAEEYLEAFAERFAGPGVRATWAVLEGSPFASIAEATGPDDLVVITSHGRGGALRWLLGSVAEKLVREAPAPVLLVPAPGRGRGAA